MTWPWTRDALTRMREDRMEEFVLKLEQEFLASDRKLARLEDDRVALLAAAKGADPLRKSVMREKYKDNRNERGDLVESYVNQMAIWKIAKEVRRIKRRSKDLGQDAILKELAAITGMSAREVSAAIDTHDVKGRVAMGVWKDLARDIDQRGLKAIDAAASAPADTEFDFCVSRLERAGAAEDVDAVIASATREFEATQVRADEAKVVARER